MRFFCIVISLIFFFGCSSQNGYTKLKVTKEQTYSLDSVQAGRVVDANRTCCVINAIYLNSVYPEAYHDGETFLISVSSKKTFLTPNFFLNGQTPTKSKALEYNEKFQEIITTTNKWTRYYLVTFEESLKPLSFWIEIDQLRSDILNYQEEPL